MSQKQLLFLQAIASFFAGGSLLCLIILFFHLFPSFLSSYSSISYGPWLEEGLKFGTALLLIRMAYFFYLATNPKYLSFKSIWYSFALLIPVYLHLLYNIIVKA